MRRFRDAVMIFWRLLRKQQSREQLTSKGSVTTEVECSPTQGLKTPFCVPTDKLLRAKDDLLSEGGQSLNSIFADCFGDCFIGIPFVGDDVVANCISKLH